MKTKNSDSAQFYDYPYNLNTLIYDQDDRLVLGGNSPPPALASTAASPPHYLFYVLVPSFSFDSFGLVMTM